MIGSLIVVLIKLSADVSRERPKPLARRLRKSDATTPHEAVAHRQAAAPRPSERLPGRPNRPETKIHRAEDDLGQDLGA
jgi:hypothetical protein